MLRKITGFVFSLFISISFLSGQNTYQDMIEKDYPYLDALYKHLHSSPELSFREKETSARLAEEMRKIGFEVTENVGGYGVVAVLKNGKGPTLLVRTDTDALPVVEETGVSYASKVKVKDDSGSEVGVMHACGHDIHMTVWTGTARLMEKLKKRWSGTLVFIAQPAEERGSGARAMIEDGLYQRFPRPDYALALHTHAEMAAGTIGYRPGFALANVDMMDIVVYGKGGHGAYPHTTIDPIVLAARIVVSLQTIVSREISPLDPAVVTVGSIHGGTKANIIGNEVKLELTLRSYTDEVREKLISGIRRICNGEAMAAGLPESMYPTINLRNEFTPATYNDPALAERLAGVWKKTLGEASVVEKPSVMGGEDFSEYGRTGDKVPISIFWLGVVEPEKIEAASKGEYKLPSLHSSKYKPVPEQSIKTGVTAMAAGILELIGQK
ncbi:MAG: amidohydrolase [Bacteroidia bacterium]